ncbi:MAG: PfkB family carbohydrate kinase [Gaiellales bacterium]
MRVAVVGHVEWLRFAAVERLPGRGDIVHSHDDWEDVGGGGGVAAIQLALLADEVHFFTQLGDDELGRRARTELEVCGVIVHAVTGAEPTRWAFVHCDEGGERTITTVGPKLHPRGHDDRFPWQLLRDVDAAFFTAGDVDALVAARRAKVLVATARELGTIARAGVELDALVRSGEDPSEAYTPGDLEPEPRLVVTTSGALGGWMQPGGPYVAATPPGEIVDAFGAGDSFMAGLTFALGSGLAAAEAVAFAARCGAAALTGRGVSPVAVSREVG